MVVLIHSVPCITAVSYNTKFVLLSVTNGALTEPVFRDVIPFGCRVITLAATFWTFCSRSERLSGKPYSNTLP